MAIKPFDLSQEGLLPLGKVPAYLHSLGSKRVHVGSIYRWALRGITADDGTTVRMETVRLGRAHYTSKAAVARFAARLKAQPQDAPERSTPRRQLWAGASSSRRPPQGRSPERDQRTREILERHDLGYHNTEVDQLLGKVGTTPHILGNARNRLFEAGIKTREALAQLDLDEFENTKGVGTMTRDVIAKAQDAVRRGEAEA